MTWLKNDRNMNKLSTYRKFGQMQIKLSKFLLTFCVKSYIIRSVYGEVCPKCRKLAVKTLLNVLKHITKENIMKKALVILLALTMVVSMFAMAPMSVAAEELNAGQVAADYKPEGEAIKTAEEFLNMKADGTYYLANDITIDETYYYSFTGTFDGNGKTITTSVTIFDNLDGTVNNLTIAGSITVEAIFLDQIGGIGTVHATGALAHYAAVNANATIDNVCNNAPLTSYASGMAGLVGAENINSSAADVDGNKDINTDDIVLIRKMIAGLV